jgi:hypothetical protein
MARRFDLDLGLGQSARCVQRKTEIDATTRDETRLLLHYVSILIISA